MSEERAAFDPSRSVMVDVGPGFGALVVIGTAELDGKEIEISPVGVPALRQHVYVLPRTLSRDTAFAAVFPRLRSGRHLLWSPQGDPVLTVVIPEGGVEEVVWPSGETAGAPIGSPDQRSESTEGD